jgi:phosphate-selective porin
MRSLVLFVAASLLSMAPWRPIQAQNPPDAPPVAAPAPPAAAPATSGPGVRFTGYVQARETYRDGVGLTGSINRARLTAFGNAAKDVTWRVQGEFRTGSVGTGKASVSLQDAYIRYKTGQFGIQAGQFKTPFTREFITSLADVETADRATVVDSIAPKRDIGVLVLPWVQLVLKQEDFRRSAITDDVRNRATTGGVNVEFGGG